MSSHRAIEVFTWSKNEKRPPSGAAVLMTKSNFILGLYPPIPRASCMDKE